MNLLIPVKKFIRSPRILLLGRLYIYISGNTVIFEEKSVNLTQSLHKKG